MKVLIVGGGGREHALGWKIGQSPQVTDLFFAPGNGGTVHLGKNLPIEATNIGELIIAARACAIDLAVIGPEAPLALGIVDEFQKAGISAFGPSKRAARIEISKVFAKELMEEYGIPCAKGVVFSTYSGAENYLSSKSFPLVIKVDGLAGGKGVTIAANMEEAKSALKRALIDGVYGDAGNEVIIEECLVGRETSFIVFTDGKTIVLMLPACDYKRVFDGDEGPMTGGMGAYCPSRFVTPALTKRILDTIIHPVIAAMAKENRPYKGVLYAGLMLTNEGPKVLEFNARFGDPETQVQLPLLKADLVDIMLAAILGNLNQIKVKWEENVSCVGVVMASAGYPGYYEKNFLITGLNKLDREVFAFHNGTKRDEQDGQRLLTDGGRVLTLVGKGKDINLVRQKIYSNLPLVDFYKKYYRQDIAEGV